MPITDETQALRADAARLARIVAVVVAVLWVLLILERLGAPAAEVVRHGADASRARELAKALVASAPDVAYLVTLHSIRAALAAFARGDFFAPTVTRLLARVGTLLAIGAFAATFVVPLVERALGFGPGYWIAFDVSGLVLGTLGLALSLIARVLKRASALEAELAGMF